MARTRSAKKAQRRSVRRHVFNLRRKTAMKGEVKEIAKALARKGANAASMLPQVQQAIDKAAKNGTIKKNTASRMKSNIAKRLAAAGK